MRWESGRASIVLSMIGHWGSRFAIGFVIICLPVVYMILIIVSKNACFYPEVLDEDGKMSELPMPVSNYGFTLDCVDNTWIWLDAFWYAIMLALLFASAQLFLSNRKMFLDRLCVHQRNMEVMGTALHRLPLYLAHTKVLYCFMDNKFMERLWCMYFIRVVQRICIA